MIKAGTRLFTCKELQLEQSGMWSSAFLLSIWRAVQTADFLHQVGSLLVIRLHWHSLLWGAATSRAWVVGDRVVAVVAGLAVAGHTAVVLLLVPQHAVLQREPPVADVAGVGPLSSVSPDVASQILSGPELSVTEETDNLPVDVVRKLSSEGIIQLLSTLVGLWRNLFRTVKSSLLQHILVFSTVVGF